MDLPGIGASTGDPTDGSNDALAAVVHGVAEALALDGFTLVGHDVGSMAAYAYLRSQRGAARVVIMDTVIPERRPVGDGARQSVPVALCLPHHPGPSRAASPEASRAYVVFLFDALTPDPTSIDADAPSRQDAADNAEPFDPETPPLLYVRGEHEGGDVDAYVEGLRAAGLSDVRSTLVPGAGHFTQSRGARPRVAGDTDFAGLRRRHEQVA